MYTIHSLSLNIVCSIYIIECTQKCTDLHADLQSRSRLPCTTQNTMFADKLSMLQGQKTQHDLSRTQSRGQIIYQTGRSCDRHIWTFQSGRPHFWWTAPSLGNTICTCRAEQQKATAIRCQSAGTPPSTQMTLQRIAIDTMDCCNAHTCV